MMVMVLVMGCGVLEDCTGFDDIQYMMCIYFAATRVHMLGPSSESESKSGSGSTVSVKRKGWSVLPQRERAPLPLW